MSKLDSFINVVQIGTVYTTIDNNVYGVDFSTNVFIKFDINKIIEFDKEKETIKVEDKFYKILSRPPPI